MHREIIAVNWHHVDEQYNGWFVGSVAFELCFWFYFFLQDRNMQMKCSQFELRFWSRISIFLPLPYGHRFAFFIRCRHFLAFVFAFVQRFNCKVCERLKDHDSARDGERKKKWHNIYHCVYRRKRSICGVSLLREDSFGFVFITFFFPFFFAFLSFYIYLRAVLVYFVC